MTRISQNMEKIQNGMFCICQICYLNVLKNNNASEYLV